MSGFDLDDIAAACARAGIPDSQYEALAIELEALAIELEEGGSRAASGAVGEWIDWHPPEGVHRVPADWAEVRRGDGQVFSADMGAWWCGTRTDDYELVPEHRVVAYRLRGTT